MACMAFSSLLARLCLVFTSVLITAVFCEQETLLHRVNTDSSWQWLTRYQLASGSGWSKDSGTGSYVVCDLFHTMTNSTNNWLVSEHVTTRETNQVELSITFNARQCDIASYPYCRQYFNVYLNQTDSPQAGGVTKANIRDNSFNFVARFNATHLWSSGVAAVDNTINVTLKLSKSGFYFALQDVGGCLAVKEIKVTYNYCPALEHNGAAFNRTVSPMKGSTSKVVGKCPSNASLFPNSSTLALDCYSNGEWSMNTSVTCLCDVGYELRDSQCIACSSLHYKPETGNVLCTSCPDNSHSRLNRDECLCNSGFYRSAGEPINSSCSAIPSAPRNLRAIPVTADVIVLSWQPPLDNGGRQDVTFSIVCSKCSGHVCVLSCEGARIWPGTTTLVSTYVTISKLERKTRYRFTVISRNGVSGQTNSNSNNATLYYLLSSRVETLTTKSPQVENVTTTTTRLTSQGAQRQTASDSSIATPVGVSVTVTFIVCLAAMLVIVSYLRRRWFKSKVADGLFMPTINKAAVYFAPNGYRLRSCSSVDTVMTEVTVEKTTPTHPPVSRLCFLPVNNIDLGGDETLIDLDSSIPNGALSVPRPAWTPTEGLYEMDKRPSTVQSRGRRNSNNGKRRSGSVGDFKRVPAIYSEDFA